MPPIISVNLLDTIHDRYDVLFTHTVIGHQYPSFRLSSGYAPVQQAFELPCELDQRFGNRFIRYFHALAEMWRNIL